MKKQIILIIISCFLCTSCKIQKVFLFEETCENMKELGYYPISKTNVESTTPNYMWIDSSENTVSIGIAHNGMENVYMNSCTVTDPAIFNTICNKQEPLVFTCISSCTSTSPFPFIIGSGTLMIILCIIAFI